MSLLHEMEHDQINSMYFRKNAFLHNLMMGGVWLFRPSTINPWVRRRLHHQKLSSTESDPEERAIANGERWGIKSFQMTDDHLLAMSVLGYVFVLAIPGGSRRCTCSVPTSEPPTRCTTSWYATPSTSASLGPARFILRVANCQHIVKISQLIIRF